MRFRCIAYDYPNGGEDGARLRRYTHADLVEDVWALLDCAGVRQGFVFGSSFGSTVALAALRARPERLRRGVLQGGFARRPLAPAEALLARLARYWPRSMNALPLRKTVFRHGHSGPFAGRAPEMWEFFLAQTGMPPIRAVARRGAVPAPRGPSAAIGRSSSAGAHGLRRLRSSGKPGLRAGAAEGAAERGAPRVGACGHFPQFTHPEVLAEVVSRFLTPPACLT